MKSIITSLIFALCVTCAVSTAWAFICIHEGVKSLNGSENIKHDSTVIGHRVNGQGQFVLVYKN